MVLGDAEWAEEVLIGVLLLGQAGGAGEGGGEEMNGGGVVIKLFARLGYDGQS